MIRRYNLGMLTAPALFALALGRSLPTGEHRCFYCGAPCDESFTARQYVADSFTERNAVVCPGSKFVCAGCVESLRSDLGCVTLLDGKTHRSKEGGKRKPREGAAGTIQVRWWTWVITEGKALAATPAHRKLLLDTCLSPPAPPFAICIADGNKHQLFRTPVNMTAGRVMLNCEGTRVAYHPEELRDRLHIVLRLVAVMGKGGNSIDRMCDPTQDMAAVLQLSREYRDADSLYQQWQQVRNEPITELAIWLCPGKDDARGCLATTAAGEIQRG